MKEVREMNIPRLLDASWLRRQYLNKALKPKDVIDEIIKRSKEDERFNIWITPPDCSFIEPYLERLSEISIENAPLWGIPFAIKDNIDLEGVRTTAGCEAYGYMPEESAVVVKKLIAAGAIPVGKTNMDQFATGLVGTRSPFGETHNALKEELISGGSSAGSAVAVARGQAVFSLGTDTAGSGRVPAALNNLHGFKPSLGAWSTKGIVFACESLDCISVFAHSIEECIGVDKVVRGYEKSDPWSRNVAPISNESPKIIYLPKDLPHFFGDFSKEYEASWKLAVKKLLSLGVVIQYIDYALFEKAAAILYEGPWIAERWATLGDFVNSHAGELNNVTEKVLRSGSALDAATLFKAIHKLKEYQLEVGKLLENGVLIMPTAGGTYSREAVNKDPIGTNSNMGRYTNHCNLLDLCAINIPAGFSKENLPFGITLFGLSGNEGWLFELANKFKNKTTFLAVCGLHMRGLPLEHQMHQYGANFVREDATEKCYAFIKLLAHPSKPGLIRKNEGGASIKLEIWEMPNSRLGDFLNEIPPPLGIGTITLLDGSSVLGFLCEEYASKEAEDITKHGGWRVAIDN